jgi:hypothetical protein
LKEVPGVLRHALPPQSGAFARWSRDHSQCPTRAQRRGRRLPARQRADRPRCVDPAADPQPGGVAERNASSISELRLRCKSDRAVVEATPALLDIAGNHSAKRAFHYQARRALTRLAEAIGFDPDDVRINTAMGRDDDEGTTELRHADIQITLRRQRQFMASILGARAAHRSSLQTDILMRWSSFNPATGLEDIMIQWSQLDYLRNRIRLEDGLPSTRQHRLPASCMPGSLSISDRSYGA